MEKLYLNDSYRLNFEGTVTQLSQCQDRPSILLDQSVFYGEAGGQLGDLGCLSNGSQTVSVIDCQYDEQGQLHHILDEPASFQVGEQLKGEINFEHRRDMMSQHSGQHLLSACFFQELGAETVSARLGRSSSTIDLDKEEITEKELEMIADLANDLVMKNSPIQANYPSDAELAAMDLRKKPKVSEGIRLIEIRGYDLMPCGGTHCSRTGEIGPIFITGKERYKKMTRIHFLAGRRALVHHRKQFQRLNLLGEQLACGTAGVEDSVVKMLKDLKGLKALLGETRATLMRNLSSELHEKHPQSETGTTPIVVVLKDEDHPDSLRSLATHLTSRSDVVALVAGKDLKTGGWRVIVACGDTANYDAGQWFRTIGKELGGRGGGRKEKAEGSFSAECKPEHFVLG